ncbi:unnamed protein product [Rhodiola kirilowii]
MSSSSTSFSCSSGSENEQSLLASLPLRKIPGSYGYPFFGPVHDRLDYFYNQGTEKFFKTRMDKYESTVFRANMPPGPFMASNPNVIVLLDAVSFPILFDTSKVEKRDVLDGTYMPSTAFTGGYRTCAYLDPSEPHHSLLKHFFLSILTARHNKFIPLFQSSMAQLFITLEDNVADKGEANYNDLNDLAAFDFVFKLFCDKDGPSETKLGSKGSSIITKWLFLQLAPLMSLGLSFVPNFVEDLMLHTFPLPFILVKSDYKKLYDVFYTSAVSLLDEAESMGISREEACHNLVFMTGFNAYGGMKAWFPNMMKWIGSNAGEALHLRLADEIRTVVKAEGGVTLSALEKMSLTKSVVYEALRLEPGVPFQYAKAKDDMIIHNHDAKFQVKKGETLFGYQPIATRDPKIFENPEEFIGNRFMGKEGGKLLKYVYWSNGRETDISTAENKICPAKDLVVLLSRVLLVEFFLRYDTFSIEATTVMLSALVKFKSLTKATS